MDKRQGRRLLALYAIDVFLDAHAKDLPQTTASRTRERFSRSLAELALHLRTQEASPLSAQGLTRAKQAQRRALVRDHLVPLSRIARLEEENIPELKAIRLPRGEPALHKLLAHAAGLAETAEKYAEVFIAAGRAPSFAEDLREAIDAILATLSRHASHRAGSVGATSGLELTLRTGRRHAAILDSFIQSEAKDDPALLANWNTVRRIGRPLARGRRRGALSPSSRIVDPARLLASGAPREIAQRTPRVHAST